MHIIYVYVHVCQVLDRDAQMDNPCKWLDDALWDNITELDKSVYACNVLYSLMRNKL